MKCIYCKAESERKICPECSSEMNNILEYNAECEHFNNIYGVFGLLKLFAFFGFLFSIFILIKESIFLSFYQAFYASLVLAILFAVIITVSTIIRFKYNKKMESIIQNEMNKRHLSTSSAL